MKTPCTAFAALCGFLSPFLLAATPATVSRASLAAQESPTELIARGRERLEAGDPGQAQQLFDRAAELDLNSAASRVWVVRGWIALGRAADALPAIDELKAAGAPAADVEYLFGLAFFAKAKQAIDQGSAGAYTQGELEDAAGYLERATRADSERYRDALLPLAEAAWYAQKLDLAIDAAARAVARSPSDPMAHALLGRAAFSQFVAQKDDPAAAEAAEASWKKAVEGFERAAKLFGEPREPQRQRLLADLHVQLAHAHQWKAVAAQAEAEKEAAERAKASQERAHAALERAMEWDPSAVDFARLSQDLDMEALEALLARASKAYGRHHSERDPGGALLDWWLGYAHYAQQEHAEAEPAFTRAVTRNPGFVNSWYYIFRSAYALQDYGRAVEALRKGNAAHAPSLVQALAGERDLNIQILTYLEGWSANPQKHGGKSLLEDAALMSELLTQLAPDNAQYWNNLGLFLRDHGEGLSRKKGTDPEELAQLWERAYQAYQKTLELAPDHPAYLNDTAVMLHYYLKRDFARAKEMYQRSNERAKEELARKDLSEGDREWFQIALRDSADNLRKLEALMKKAPGASGEPPDRPSYGEERD
jgi:hypothetical protein